MSDVLATISTVEYDPAGYIELDVLPSSADTERRRRVNRVATLDGGAVFNDGGFSHADITVDLVWRTTSAVIDAAVLRLVGSYTRLQISIGGAMYLAVPETYTPGPEQSKLRLLVVSSLTD